MEMDRLLLVFSLSIFGLVIRSGAVVTPDEYWKEILPNTMMPQLIKDTLPLTGTNNNLNMGRKDLSLKNSNSLSDSKSYGVLLSYSDEGSLRDTKSYGSSLLYHSNKDSLSSNNGGDGVFWSSYDTNPGKNKYLRLLSDVKDSLLESIDNKIEVLFHKDNKKNQQPMMDHFFFLEKDLHIGKNMKLHLETSTLNTLFLPRQVSKSIPFSSDKVEEIMSILSIDPKSTRAQVLKERIALCEQPKVEGIDMQCVTSLESMVDFVISNIGKNVMAKSTKIDKHMKMEFTIVGVTQVAKDNEAMVCHKLDYPYGLFFCHTTVSIRAYVVNMVAEDGTKMEGMAVCHKETNKVLGYYEINVLKVKPGSIHICHFPEDAVIWYPK